MKRIGTIKWVALAAWVSLIPLASPGIQLDLSNALGRAEPGVPANAVTDESQVNALVDRANGLLASPYDIGGNTYTLLNDPAVILPYAVFVSGGGVGGDDEIDLGLGGYRYLAVKYTGNNGSLLVWDIGGLAGVQDILAEDLGDKSANYNLFNAVPAGVPDGGSTVALFGIAIGGLGLIRRKLGVS